MSLRFTYKAKYSEMDFYPDRYPEITNDYSRDKLWMNIEASVFNMCTHYAYKSNLQACIIGQSGLHLKYHYINRMPLNEDSLLGVYFITKDILSEYEVRRNFNLPYGELNSVNGVCDKVEFQKIVKDYQRIYDHGFLSDEDMKFEKSQYDSTKHHDNHYYQKRFFLNKK